MKIADICCNGRLVSVLEGGYGEYDAPNPAANNNEKGTTTSEKRINTRNMSNTSNNNGNHSNSNPQKPVEIDANAVVRYLFVLLPFYICIILSSIFRVFSRKAI
jgi:ATP-dependent Zn protease